MNHPQYVHHKPNALVLSCMIHQSPTSLLRRSLLNYDAHEYSMNVKLGVYMEYSPR